MNILVCITHVPDTTSKINFTDDKSFDKSGVQYIIGPYDDYALARAVELKEAGGGEITVLNVGTAETEPTIRKALAIGADKAIRVNAEPTGSVFVAKQIAEIAKNEKYDMILTGRESIDYNGGLVHGMLGALLGIPSVSPITKLDLDGDNAQLERVIDGGTQILEVSLPFVAGCQEPIAEWKIPNMRGIMQARQKPLDVIEPESFSSQTSTLKYSKPEEKGKIRMINPENLDELVEILHTEEKII